MNKITCICLGVRDMARSVAFYRDGLGFRTNCVEDSPRVCFFDTPGTSSSCTRWTYWLRTFVPTTRLPSAVGSEASRWPTTWLGARRSTG